MLDACPGIKVYADRGKIGQVFTNLISNAIKYSPAGSDILVSCALKGEKVGVAVTDYGLGISKESEEKLFKRFYRVEDGRTRNISGFGIGMYLVSGILRYHDAAINVKSELNQGSVFLLPWGFVRDAAEGSPGFINRYKGCLSCIGHEIQNSNR